MATFNAFSSIVFSAVILAVTATASHAFDPSKTFKAGEEPREILRYGFKALKDNRIEDAMGAFRFGAEQNDVMAQWKLARMMQNGDQGVRNHADAVMLFRKIANRHGDQMPPAREMVYVSGALVTLGLYALHGVEGSGMSRNPRTAESYFYRAAALYHDPEAQYQLGSLYRGEVLGEASPRSAARWLSLSARKGHPWAQAELGQMLIDGEGLRSSPVRGLVMLARSIDTLGTLDPVVTAINKNAWAAASESDRKSADTVLAATRLNGPSPYASRRLVRSMGFPRVAGQ
ncbi:tetratricopeptide repeat protein [Ahrensia sp. R2A130]|uniref:tetratricopeptide repeat protein n=1 Tax=Ahrensia sp. R2A130 TaxID=744979 RepID=UPI0001E0D0B0|nr:tetratricopeptide repeat protein [Ahrensia sp. R2A130]EFL90303.1 Sel1 repeat-containing protein [Ahrensia sp. R2A130]